MYNTVKFETRQISIESQSVIVFFLVVFLCFDNEASRDRFVGQLVSWSVLHKSKKSYKNDLYGCQLSTYSTRCLELG